MPKITIPPVEPQDVLNEFRDKYESFELCETTNKGDYDRLAAFFHKQIEKAKREQMYEQINKDIDIVQDFQKELLKNNEISASSNTYNYFDQLNDKIIGQMEQPKLIISNNNNDGK